MWFRLHSLEAAIDIYDTTRVASFFGRTNSRLSTIDTKAINTRAIVHPKPADDRPEQQHSGTTDSA